MFAVAGRVLGPDGTPLAEIPIKVQVRTSQNNFPGFAAQVRFEDGREIKTAADGSFTTPKEIERKPSEVRIEVAAEGFLPARTAWVAAPKQNFSRSPTSGSSGPGASGPSRAGWWTARGIPWPGSRCRRRATGRSGRL